MRAIGRWRVLGHVRREPGSSERVCTRAIDVVHVFHGGTVRFVAGAAIVDGMVLLQRKEKGEKKRGEAWASEADGGEGGGRAGLSLRCGDCCTLTMRAMHHDHQEGWRGW